ncbi:MAG TPA: ribonuclease III [Phycisphaerae bacterium]|nr:ribonuclease III [Phycisphaerae bacterium]HOJ53878.1 ribonuclease III [Phycisphaerae bacterium]HOL26209.1 ribonuclease III [Phycisphaerae bacterium]HPP20196.1 ribonuclease III [Phycisphaerae bacterium]HPU33711.1 ribonuclease III [Phycisphaerae bacterium]
MTEAQALQGVQEAIGYTFKDPSLLAAALTHASSADCRLHSNERMEFVGDSILGMVVCAELYKRFPDYLEGELTKIKSAVVSRKTCAQISRELNLPRYLFLGKGMSGRAPLPNSLAAAVYESLIAAIYLDSNDLEVTRNFILKTVSHHITQAVESEHQRNYKSQLQQYAQRMMSATPIYDLLDEKGPDHSKCFEVSVVIQGHRFTSAWGPSKKEAEQKAAYLALRELNAIKPSAEFEAENDLYRGEPASTPVETIAEPASDE